MGEENHGRGKNLGKIYKRLLESRGVARSEIWDEEFGRWNWKKFNELVGN